MKIRIDTNPRDEKLEKKGRTKGEKIIPDEVPAGGLLPTLS